MKADSEKVVPMLKTAKGQIDGILKMIEDDRYCIDISNQLLAVSSLIKKANTEVLRAHLGSCIRESVQDGNDDKIDEIMKLLDKIYK